MQESLFADIEIKPQGRPVLSVDNNNQIVGEDAYDPADYVEPELRSLQCPRCGKFSEKLYEVERGARGVRKTCYRCRDSESEYIPVGEEVVRSTKEYRPPVITIIKGPVHICRSRSDYDQASIAALRCPLLREEGLIVVMGKEQWP